VQSALKVSREKTVIVYILLVMHFLFKSLKEISLPKLGVIVITLSYLIRYMTCTNVTHDLRK